MNKIIFLVMVQLISVLSYAESNHADLIIESNILEGNKGNGNSNTGSILGRTNENNLSLGGIGVQLL